MNAVNLIPKDQRRRGTSSTMSVPFLALIAGLVIVLAGTVVFVIAHNRVDSRQARLAAVQASTARWSQAAGTYADDITANKLRQSTILGVQNLAGERPNWSELLAQLAAVMPKHSQLSSMSASTSGTSDATASAPTASTASSATGSQLQIAACATSQYVVAQTMINLRRISGVSGVFLGSDGSGSSGGVGSCGYPVDFTFSLTYTPPATDGKAASGATATTESTSATPQSSGTEGAAQ